MALGSAALLESQHLGGRGKRISLDCVEPLEKKKRKRKTIWSQSPHQKERLLLYKVIYGKCQYNGHLDKVADARQEKVMPAPL